MPTTYDLLAAWMRPFRCPNCAHMPWHYAPTFPWEVPQAAPECVCEICGASLVRDVTPNKYGGRTVGAWRLRDGAPVPPDLGEWPDKARAVLDARKAAELAQSQAWVNEELRRYKCPACGESVETDGMRRLKKHPEMGKIDKIDCQACGVQLKRAHGRMPLAYRGQKLGFTYPWEADA